MPSGMWAMLVRSPSPTTRPQKALGICCPFSAFASVCCYVTELSFPAFWDAAVSCG